MNDGLRMPPAAIFPAAFFGAALAIAIAIVMFLLVPAALALAGTGTWWPVGAIAFATVLARRLSPMTRWHAGLLGWSGPWGTLLLLGCLAVSWSGLMRLDATVVSIASVVGVFAIAQELRRRRSAEASAAYSRRAEGLGALLGLAGLSLWFAQSALPEPTRAMASRSLALLVEIAPALLAAYVITGVLAAFAPSDLFRWFARGTPLVQASKGLVVGLPLPLCSCSVVAPFRRIAQQGGSTAGAMAFLIAGPELGLDAILLSFPALGTDVAVARIAAAIAVALVVALVMDALVRRRLGAARHYPAPLPEAAVATPWPARVRHAWHVGFEEMFGHTAPWIALGVLAAAWLGPTPAAAWLASLPVFVQVVALSLLGLPAYVCASAATPLIATLIAGGVSPGAGIAFLITGPAANVTTFGLVARLYGRRLAVVFVAVVAATAVSLGLLLGGLPLGIGPSSATAVVANRPSVLQHAAIALLLVLLASQLLRRGPRALIGELRMRVDDAAHDHHGDHGRTHAHETPSRHTGSAAVGAPSAL